MRFIDISGFGHSGKTAVTDYLKQYECVFAFPNHVEFEIIRVPGGLLDLYFSIYESWNLIRSTVRINDFKALINRIGTVQQVTNPISYFTASGHGYNALFNNRFIELSNQLIDRIITGKQNTFWPYENLRVHPLRVFFNKFRAKFFGSLLTSEIYFSNRNDFLEYTRAYMQELFLEATETRHTHVLLNNGFEPFNPTIPLDIIGDAYSIVVNRDPRDIYASQINSSDTFVPSFEKNKNVENIKKSFTGFNDINHFIFRYKTLNENVLENKDPRIIKVNYEDFILNHEIESKRIKDIVGVNTGNITEINFDVSKSINNVGLWKKYVDLPEIKLIEKQLSQFCYNS